MYIARYHIFFLSIFSLVLVIFGLSLSPEARAQDKSGSGLKKVVIDPGHGGRDPGAVGLKSKEKDIVLDISLRVGKKISAEYPDVEVIYTRKTDKFIELDKRGEIANKAHADLFISIHANANKKKTPYGTETFVMGNSRSAENMEVAKRENAVILIEDDYSNRYEGFDPNSSESYIYFSLLQNAYLNHSLSFATEVQELFKNSAKRADRGVKQANFLVLWKTAMPGVLIEVGFISNAEEEKYMNSEKGKEQLSDAIFQAFCSYKSRIEARSAFKPSGAPTSEEKEKTSEVKSDSATPVKTPDKQSTTAVSRKVEFCVQVSSSSKPMNTDPNNFKKQKGVERIQVSANLYKYIVGRTPDYTVAQETLKSVRESFNDAFVVGLVDGKVVPAGEALMLMKP